MTGIQRGFNTGKSRAHSLGYNRYCDRIRYRREKIQRFKTDDPYSPEIDALKREIKELDSARKLRPSVEVEDQEYRRLYDCRYADDFLIGIIGSKADAQKVMQQVEHFITAKLNRNISTEKSGIRHAKQGVMFLGYDVRTFTGDRVVKTIRHGTHTTFRSTSERIYLLVPRAKVQAFCQHRGYGDYDGCKATDRRYLLHSSDAEIILTYNAELRGFANYYALSPRVKKELHQLM